MAGNPSTFTRPVLIHWNWKRLLEIGVYSSYISTLKLKNLTWNPSTFTRPILIQWNWRIWLEILIPLLVQYWYTETEECSSYSNALKIKNVSEYLSISTISMLILWNQRIWIESPVSLQAHIFCLKSQNIGKTHALHRQDMTLHKET